MIFNHGYEQFILYLLSLSALRPSHMLAKVLPGKRVPTAAKHTNATLSKSPQFVYFTIYGLNLKYIVNLTVINSIFDFSYKIPIGLFKQLGC